MWWGCQLLSVRGWVDPRATVCMERTCQWKIPMTPSGIKPTTLHLVEHCLNQLQHCVPPHQPTLTLKWCHMMIHDLASSCVLYFIVSYRINTPVFLFTHTNSTSFCSKSWKHPCLGPVKDFWAQFTFINFCLCCLHFCMFASTTFSMVCFVNAVNHS
jgi:hypothetical protein